MGLLAQLNGQSPAARVEKAAQPMQTLEEEEKEEAVAKNEDVYEKVKERLRTDIVPILSEITDKQKASESEEDEENKKDKTLEEKQLEKEALVKQTVMNLMDNNQDSYKVPRQDREAVAKEVVADVVGYGPIQDLLNNDDVSEIMVNGPDMIYVEEHGRLQLSKAKFRNDQHVMDIINRIVSPLGRHVDESSPTVDARLPDGSRVNAVVPPIALNGPTITIRKFPKSSISMEDMIKWGSVDRRMTEFLNACVKARLNIIVSGGTGSGKTTLLNALSSFIPDTDRILTIEDSAELQLQQKHVVRLEARPANTEGTGQVSINDLVINALRMRPDRIIVGECRGGEALAMLQAMNTGHDGSLTTGHANTAKDMISRLETMVMMSGVELPEKAIDSQIASAINIIVQQARLQDGSRKIIGITEVTGMEGEHVQMQDIFKFYQTGVKQVVKDGQPARQVEGYFDATGVQPMCKEKFEQMGIYTGENWFVKQHKD